jgi:hypothetical protein
MPSTDARGERLLRQPSNCFCHDIFIVEKLLIFNLYVTWFQLSIRPLTSYLAWRRIVRLRELDLNSTMSSASRSFLSDLEAIAGLQVTVHRIKVAVVELHVAGIVFDINHVLTDVHRHEPIRG